MSALDKEFELPQASVARILKGKLPEGISVSKEAKHAFARSAGVFILYLTSTANENCKNQKRQTLSAKDILMALRLTQFEDFVEPLEASLDQLRGASARKKIKVSNKDSEEVEEMEDKQNDEKLQVGTTEEMGKQLAAACSEGTDKLDKNEKKGEEIDQPNEEMVDTKQETVEKPAESSHVDEELAS